MPIAEIAVRDPTFGYGVFERVIHDLSEGFIGIGVDVTLFAPKGSESSAEIIETLAKPVGMNMSEAQKRRFLVDTCCEAFRGARLAWETLNLAHDPPRRLAL